MLEKQISIIKYNFVDFPKICRRECREIGNTVQSDDGRGELGRITKRHCSTLRSHETVVCRKAICLDIQIRCESWREYKIVTRLAKLSISRFEIGFVHIVCLKFSPGKMEYSFAFIKTNLLWCYFATNYSGIRMELSLRQTLCLFNLCNVVLSS